MHALRCTLRLQSSQSSGPSPTTSECRRTLTCRSFAVALPFHWHCSRNGHGRQLRMLAAYTTRRLPSASRRLSWRGSVAPAGQRSVPSDWRGKFAPVKRPVFQEVAVVGGPYPEAGADSVGGHGSLFALLWEGRSKLGRAQWLWLELMAQFESQVPEPLRDHLPARLTPIGVNLRKHKLPRGERIEF